MIRIALVVSLALLTLSLVRVDRAYEVPPSTTSTTDLSGYLDCYHDPDTEPWLPNLPVPAPGECP